MLSSILLLQVNTIITQSINNEKIVKWCQANKLTINEKKTEAMWINGGLKLHDSELSEIKINNIPIKYCNEFKYLGLWIDKQLKFEKHLYELSSKIKRQIGMLYRCRRYLTFSQSIFLYKTLILPIFDYVDIFYESANKSGLENLQILQNRCLRICYPRNKWPGTIKAHTENKLLFLKDRGKLHLAQIALSYKSNIDKSNKVKSNKHDHNTRSKNKNLLDPMHSKYKVIDKSGTQGIPELWNSLPDFVRKVTSKEELDIILPIVLWAERLKQYNLE